MPHIQLSKSDTELFQSLGYKFYSGSNERDIFHLPQYFKSVGNDVYELLTFDELPEHVKEILPIKEACKKHSISEGENDEMDIDYSIIEDKVKELNRMGIDITLQEIGDIIESKFLGTKQEANLRRFYSGKNEGKLMYPKYTVLKIPENEITIRPLYLDY